MHRLVCVHCAAEYPADQVIYTCSRCGHLLAVEYPLDEVSIDRSLWHRRPLSVWRYRELLPVSGQPVTLQEGGTPLYRLERIGADLGLPHLYAKHEGMNPSGSFKDRGMTVGVSMALELGMTSVACASTGNTSASLAQYAARAGIPAVVLLPAGKVALGKVAQALMHGARVISIRGNFDRALEMVHELCLSKGLYLLNSVNPFRLEGQKTIMFRVLESLGWEVPDWIVVPGGNLGNSSAFGKAFMELEQLGLIDRIPRLAIVNAAGANTLNRLVGTSGLRWNGGRTDPRLVKGFYDQMDAEGRRAETIASAIEINRPVNLEKCLRALDVCDGVVREATDQEILDAKAQVGAGGIGCEPASAASVAGAKQLVEQGVIGRDQRVVCILTGHQLKDPTATVAYHTTDQQLFNDVLGKRGVRRAAFANRAVVVPNDLGEIVKAIELYS